MPAYAQHPSHWLGQQIGGAKSTARSIAQQAALGAWTPLALGPKVKRQTVGQEPGVRQEIGSARLRGLVVVKTRANSTEPSNAIAAGETILTVPIGLRPPDTVFLAGSMGDTVVMSIDAEGNLSISIGLPEGEVIPLDGVTYNLS